MHRSRQPRRLISIGAIGCGLLLAIPGCSPGEPSALDCSPPPTFTDAPGELIVEPLGDPTWTVASDEASFSSPRLFDLSGDGVLDVVQGFGQDTFGARMSSLVAIDGATGAELWRSDGHEDLIGAAQFTQLGGDATTDVVIGGRRGALLAVDGASGETLWTFDDQAGRWFNFYTPQIVDDQNDDDVVDIVATNGGLIFDEPGEGGGVPDPEQRNLGTTFLVSGADGTVIASIPAPDRGEQYMSPIVVPGQATEGNNTLDLLIGTGGETLPGSVWRMPLSALTTGATEQTYAVLSDANKGMIAPPSLAHINADCTLDIVAQSFGGTLSAVDGATNELLWELENPGFETYSAPTLGYFVGDDAHADVFVAMARGVWPDYESSDYLLVDGATGSVVWRQTLGTFAPSGFVAADLNGDGRDEVLFGVNHLDTNTHELFVIDTSELKLHALSPTFNQTTFSTPWIGDVDNNGMLDLVVSESAYQSNGPANIHRFELPWATPKRIAWGGYLGTSTNGIVQ